MTNNKKVKMIISNIVEKIKRQYRPEKIVLFGSYAYGSPVEDSDIDLLIIKETCKRPVDRRVEVRKIIYDQKRRVPVSPLVFTKREINKRLDIGDDFFQEIMGRGKVLYEEV